VESAQGVGVYLRMKDVVHVGVSSKILALRKHLPGPNDHCAANAPVPRDPEIGLSLIPSIPSLPFSVIRAMLQRSCSAE
jgi:hypothetical protein